MTSRRRIAALTAGALGTVAAGAVARALAEKRPVGGAADAGEERFGRLRSTPLRVVADDGVVLHAEVDEASTGSTPGDGSPTLVFVHGYALNLDCWHFQRAHYRGRRRMVLYDQRSHGRSQRSTKGNATIDQLGHDLLTVLDELAPDDQVVLVGHSMGGMTIMALAEHHPEIFGDRVVGVGLVSTTAGGLRAHRLLNPFLPDRVMEQVTPRVMAGLARAPWLVDRARRAGSDLGQLVTSRFAFGKEVPASYARFVDEMLAQTPFEVLAEFFPNFAALDKFSVLEAFAQVPTVIVCGSKDVMTSVDHSRKMARLIDTAELVECPDSGHLVILESAQQVNDALDRMLTAAEPGPAEARRA